MFFNLQNLRIISCRKRSDFSRRKKSRFLREKTHFFSTRFFRAFAMETCNFRLQNEKAHQKTPYMQQGCNQGSPWLQHFCTFSRKKSCVFFEENALFFGTDFCEFLQLENEIFDCKSIGNIVNNYVFQLATLKNHRVQKTNRFFDEKKVAFFLREKTHFFSSRFFRAFAMQTCNFRLQIEKARQKSTHLSQKHQPGQALVGSFLRFSGEKKLRFSRRKFNFFRDRFLRVFTIRK